MVKTIVSIVFMTFVVFACIVESHADDVDLFLASIPPDALIVLDLSGSMKWTTTGGTLYIPTNQICAVYNGPYYLTSASDHSKPCTTSMFPSNYPSYSNSSCSGPFYLTSSSPDHPTNCGRLAIAKRSIFDLLDDNDDSAINSQDETSLGIRFGYMRFYSPTNDGNDTLGDYNAGNIRLGRKNTSGCICPASPTCSETSDALGIGSSFGDMYNRINCEVANSGTPLASSLNEAKLYLDAHKAADPSQACRKKFVILVTDGEDTYACSGNGVDGQPVQRRESVARAKALANAGYKVFVVGFGANMPDYLKNTLNWMSYYGGTDNTLVANSGDTSQYNIPSGSLYPSGISGCPSTIASPDPGALTLSGYAFFAEDASQLTAALKTIKTYIQDKSTSYSGAAIPSVRYVSGDTAYVSSFEIPSWNGYLKAYQLNADGTLPIDPTTKKITATPIWDAAALLNVRDPSTRNIYTYSGSFKNFAYDQLTNAELGYSPSATYDSQRQNVVNYVRGQGRSWKLGDIFHSSPVIVGEPSRYFEDSGFSGSGGFYDTNKNRTKVIIVGANDGMLHAFNASTGVEQWGFIPQSLLVTLQSMLLPFTHTYYVDSSPKVADVWLYSNSVDTTKTVDEWKTVLVSGLRKGGKTDVILGTDGLNYTCIKDHTADAANRPTTGSSWATYWTQQGTGAGTWGQGGDVVLGTDGLNYTCIKDHTADATNRPITGTSWSTYWVQQGTGGLAWASGTGYYARRYSAKGYRYFALDITNTVSPQYLWQFPSPTDATTLAKVGQSWSEPVIGRVKREVGSELYERWVAFIGGGYDSTNSTGKAFFVIDMKTGEIIKEFSGLTGMTYSFAASPTAVDTNSDGFIDKVYIGDLGGQMWVFDVSFNAVTKLSNSLWTGRRLFTSPISVSETHRIYYQPSVAFDSNMIPWVYFGTGDRENPNDLTNPNERFYAVKDSGAGNYPRVEDTDLLDVTSVNTFTPTSQDGWYIKLAKDSQKLEKVLAKPVVFNRLVYFTTYSNVQAASPCSPSGESKLYIVEYLSGGGALEVDSLADLGGSPSTGRSISIGGGAPSAPVISVDVKAQATVTVGTSSDQLISLPIFSEPSSKKILYWREVTP